MLNERGEGKFLVSFRLHRLVERERRRAAAAFRRLGGALDAEQLAQQDAPHEGPDGRPALLRVTTTLQPPMDEAFLHKVGAAKRLERAVCLQEVVDDMLGEA